MATREQALTQLEAELRVRLDKYHAHVIRQNEPLQADFSEQAIQKHNDEVVEELEIENQQRLTQVHHALERIKQGKGDVCEGCDSPIGEERLVAIPESTLCISCADKAY